MVWCMIFLIKPSKVHVCTKSVYEAHENSYTGISHSFSPVPIINWVFKTQFKLSFLTLFTGGKKCLEKIQRSKHITIFTLGYSRKINVGGWGYTFLKKKTLEFLDLSLYSALEIPEKTSLHSWKFWKRWCLQLRLQSIFFL